MQKFKGSLYLITDSTYHTEESLLWTVEEAIKGGVSIVQLREKNRSTREYIDLANKVKKITDKYDVPLIIDDRIDVAMVVKSSGVHLGQSDMPVKNARELLGEEVIIGATAKTVEQAVEAYNQGADYIGTGAIYPTTTKVKTVITSVDTLDDIVKNVDIPVYAIGGLNKDNIDVLKGVNISGICVVSAIMKSENPRKSSEEILKSIENVLGIV